MFNFQHKNTEFFDLFVESAKCFYRGALMLDEVMLDYTRAADKMKAVIDLEQEADAINDRIIDELNQTFITPIDREDIFALANGLDDGVDFLQNTLQRLVIYRTGPAKEGVITLTKLLLEATREVITAFTLLKDIKKNREKLLETTHKIGKLESEGDVVYRQEIAYLFDHVTDPIDLIKWKDILENLENTMDHCEDVSDMIRGVVMKYA